MPECSHCKSKFEITAFEQSLRHELAPELNDRKFALPPPTVCPICRHRRRLAFRNERKLYRNTCAISKRPIISSYSPDKPDKVVSRTAWLELENTQFGRDYDFGRSFFSQFGDLTRDTFKANVAQAGEIINSEYTHSVGWLKDCYLLFDSGNCQNLLGCSELRKKAYCILNKQYSKDEYEALVPKIIDQMVASSEWGNFFPFSLSPYGYNESLAQEEFPLDISEAEALGANWTDYSPALPSVTSSIQAASLERVDDSLLNMAIQCEESQRPYKLIPLELTYLKRFKLPPPRKHPELRERDRRLRKNARRIEKRNCKNCNLATDTAVNYRHHGPILCERCYEKELY